MLTQRFDDTEPLPRGTEAALDRDHPRLRGLREAYALAALPVTARSVWDGAAVADVDLRYFRGDNLYVWVYREWPRAMALKYYLLAEYVRARDPANLLDRLGEDGAFGCWAFEYPGLPRVSRDLLDSVNELAFLQRRLGLLDQAGLRVLDIGAGYGRSAHRMAQAVPGLVDYCCVDAVPESTFLCEHYVHHRGVAPPVRVVPLHEIEGATQRGGFDLALNIHSFSECTYDAVAWWLALLDRLEVPNLLVIPNDGDELLAYETDGSRRDFRPLVENAGYELAASEPVINDAAVRELLRIDDRFMLFRRAT
jgi:SAM-dependent methyltransferase